MKSIYWFYMSIEMFHFLHTGMQYSDKISSIESWMLWKNENLICLKKSIVDFSHPGDLICVCKDHFKLFICTQCNMFILLSFEVKTVEIRLLVVTLYNTVLKKPLQLCLTSLHRIFKTNTPISPMHVSIEISQCITVIVLFILSYVNGFIQWKHLLS